MQVKSVFRVRKGLLHSFALLGGLEAIWLIQRAGCETSHPGSKAQGAAAGGSWGRWAGRNSQNSAKVLIVASDGLWDVCSEDFLKHANGFSRHFFRRILWGAYCVCMCRRTRKRQCTLPWMQEPRCQSVLWHGCLPVSFSPLPVSAHGAYCPQNRNYR